FQAEDGIRDRNVTGVQTCALPICTGTPRRPQQGSGPSRSPGVLRPTRASGSTHPSSLCNLLHKLVSGSPEVDPETPREERHMTRSEERRVGKGARAEVRHEKCKNE